MTKYYLLHDEGRLPLSTAHTEADAMHDAKWYANRLQLYRWQLVKETRETVMDYDTHDRTAQ
jgi:hypothetical protein